jgi:hypothetical protein
MSKTALTDRERAQLELMLEDCGMKAVLDVVFDHYQATFGRGLTVTDIWRIMIRDNADVES